MFIYTYTLKWWYGKFLLNFLIPISSLLMINILPFSTCPHPLPPCPAPPTSPLSPPPFFGFFCTYSKTLWIYFDVFIFVRACWPDFLFWSNPKSLQLKKIMDFFPTLFIFLSHRYMYGMVYRFLGIYILLFCTNFWYSGLFFSSAHGFSRLGFSTKICVFLFFCCLFLFFP